MKLMWGEKEVEFVEIRDNVWDAATIAPGTRLQVAWDKSAMAWEAKLLLPTGEMPGSMGLRPQLALDALLHMLRQKPIRFY